MCGSEVKEKAAYMIVSGVCHDEEKAKIYSDAAVPLAKQAGMEVVASSAPVLLEGEWSHPGVVLIEKFDSMKKLKDYWHSEEFKAAKKLREGVIDMNFIIAIEEFVESNT